MKYTVCWNMICSRDVEVDDTPENNTDDSRIVYAAIEEATDISYREMANYVDDVHVTYVVSEDGLEYAF